MNHDPSGVADRISKLALGYYGGDVAVERKLGSSEFVLSFGPQQHGAFAGPGEKFTVIVMRKKQPKLKPKPTKHAKRHAEAVRRSIEAWSLRAEGLMFKEIGARYGISVNRARQIVMRGSREIRASLLRSDARFRVEKTDV